MGKRKSPILAVLWCVPAILLTTCASHQVTPISASIPTQEPTLTDLVESHPLAPLRWFVGLGPGTNSAQIDIEKQIVEAFNSGISLSDHSLVLEEVPNEDANDTVATEIAAGVGPDIIGPGELAAQTAFHDEWLDLTSSIEKTGFDLAQFTPSLVEYYHTDEGQIAVPFAVSPAVLFYQKGMFDHASLDYPPASFGEPYRWPDGTKEPWNFDTLAKVARLLTLDSNGRNAAQPGFDAAHIVQYGYAIQSKQAMPMAVFWGSSKFFTGESGAYTAIIQPQWKAAWQWYQDGLWGVQPFMPTCGGSNDINVANLVNSLDLFDSQKVAMTIAQLWSDDAPPNAGQSWDLGALPAYNGQVHSYLDADAFFIWKGTPTPEESFEVVSYLTTKVASELRKIFPGMPARTADQEAYLSQEATRFPSVKNWTVLKDSLDYSDSSFDEYNMPNFYEAWARLNQFGSEITCNPKADLDTELEKLQLDLQTIFNK